MIILAIDTSMAACSAALLSGADSGSACTVRRALPGRGHAEILMPMVVDVMTEAGINFDALERIAVTVGPGSFSGVRVGVAAARGLALATGASVVGMTSLKVMAAGARNQLAIGQDELLSVAHDARRGQIYFGQFDGDGHVHGDEALLSPEAGAQQLDRGAWLAGSGAALVAAADPSKSFSLVLPDLLPDAEDLARMAFHAEPDTVPLSPLYLRPPDAKPQSGKSVPRRA